MEAIIEIFRSQVHIIARPTQIQNKNVTKCWHHFEELNKNEISLQFDEKFMM